MNNYGCDFDCSGNCDLMDSFFDLIDYLVKDIQYLQKEVVHLRYDLSNLLPEPYDGLMIRTDIFSDLAGCYYDHPAYRRFIAAYFNGIDPLDCHSYCEELKEIAHFEEGMYHRSRFPPPTESADGKNSPPCSSKNSFVQVCGTEKAIPLVGKTENSVLNTPAVVSIDFIKFIDLSTRLKRMKMTALMVDLLGSIKAAEELTISRTQENLQNGCLHCDSKNPAGAIGEAIENLIDAY